MAQVVASRRSIISRVFVVGGTHGNEYTGVWVVKALEARRSRLAAAYPHLRIETIVGNPAAFAANQRFVDVDLNRQFGRDEAQTWGDRRELVEVARAAELDAILGPKFATNANDDDPVADVVVDLHSTTANMGVTLIITEHDPLMIRCCAYVLAELGVGRTGADAIRVLAHETTREETPGVSSVGRHALTIEVGPVPQGVVRHDAVIRTEAVLAKALEFFDHLSTEATTASWDLPATIPVFRSLRGPSGQNLGKLAWPTDPKTPNFPAAIVHESLQDRDWAEVTLGDPLFITLDGAVVPYDGSHGDRIRCIFVNEGGYYYASSGTGIGVVTADILSVPASSSEEDD